MFSLFGKNLLILYFYYLYASEFNSALYRMSLLNYITYKIFLIISPGELWRYFIDSPDSTRYKSYSCRWDITRYRSIALNIAGDYSYTD